MGYQRRVHGEPPFWLQLQHTGIFCSATAAETSYNEGEKNTL